jgi:hypothetical protein
MSCAFRAGAARLRAQGIQTLVEDISAPSSQPREEVEQTVSSAMIDSSPVARKAGERQDLYRKVSGLKGRPFTAAFLAAATGTEVGS